MIKIIYVPGKTIEIEKATVGMSLAEVFKLAEIEVRDNQAVAVGDSIVLRSEFSKVHIIDGNIIIATGCKGHAPIPNLKSTIKHLKSKGFQKVQGGKGDHEKFSGPNGETVILNKDNSDKQHTCLGSAKSLASLFGINLVQLYAQIK